MRLVREGETSRIGNEENKPPTTYTPVKQNKNMDNRTNINYNSETSPILKEKKIVQPNNSYSYKDQPGVSMKHSLDSTPQAYKPISYSGIHSNNNDSRTNLFPSSKPRDVSPMSNSYILPQSSSQIFSSSNMNNNQTYKDHTIRDMIPDSRSVSPIQSHDNRRHFQVNPEPVYVQNRNGEYRPVQSSSNELSLAPNSIQFKQTPYTVSSHEDREDGFTQGAFGETSNFYHPPPASNKQSDDTNTQKFYPPGLNYYPVVITKAQELDLRPIVIRSRSNTPIRNTLGGLTAVAEGVSRVTGNPGLQFPKDRSVSPVPSTFKDQPLMRQSGTSTMTHPGSVNTGATNLADHISMGYSAMQRNPQTSLSTSMYYPHTQGQTTSKQFETPSHTSYINNSQYIASSQYAPHSHHHEYNPNIPQDAKVLQFVTKSKTSHHDIENQRNISPIRTVKVIRNGVEYSEQNAESASVKYPQNPQHFPRFVQNNHP